MKINFLVFQHTDNEPCPIGFCERICVELAADLDEIRFQVVFLPVNVYVEDNIVVSKLISIVRTKFTKINHYET